MYGLNEYTQTMLSSKQFCRLVIFTINDRCLKLIHNAIFYCPVQYGYKWRVLFITIDLDCLIIKQRNNVVYILNTLPFKADCGQTLAPSNGTVSATNGTQYNAEVYFACNVGFTIQGNASNVCQLSGKWEPGTPTCQLIGYDSF